MAVTRYLVCHRYGMGALWWWICAESPEDILVTFAEVEIVDDPGTLHSVESWRLEDLDIADAAAGPLRELAERRAQQRQDPAFGKLLGKDRVYLRMDGTATYLGEWFTEHDSTGSRLRQVEVRPDGTTVATTPDDWAMDVPLDLADPQYARMEISKEEFERLWQRATGSPWE